MTKYIIGKCSVWVYGSVEGTAGLIEGKVLEVGEGFKNQREAEKWGAKKLKEIALASYYKIGPAY